MIRHLYRWQEQSKGMVSKEGFYCFYILPFGLLPRSRDLGWRRFVPRDERRRRKRKGGRGGSKEHGIAKCSGYTLPGIPTWTVMRLEQESRAQMAEIAGCWGGISQGQEKLDVVQFAPH